jgi:hypothetical protein
MTFQILRGTAAMIVGYGAIVGSPLWGLTVLWGGRTLYGGLPLILAAGILVAVIAGLVGGYIAGFIGPGRGLLNASLVLVPLVGDTIFVLFFFKRSTAPFSFDAIAAATLMMCTVGGGFLSELRSGGVKTRA